MFYTAFQLHWNWGWIILTNNSHQIHISKMIDIKFDYFLTEENDCYPWKKHPSPTNRKEADAITVETTAYALLTAVQFEDDAWADQLACWLTSQENYHGGFISTQVIAPPYREWTVTLKTMSNNLFFYSLYKGYSDGTRSTVRVWAKEVQTRTRCKHDGYIHCPRKDQPCYTFSGKQKRESWNRPEGNVCLQCDLQ